MGPISGTRSRTNCSFSSNQERKLTDLWLRPISYFPTSQHIALQCSVVAIVFVCVTDFSCKRFQVVIGYSLRYSLSHPEARALAISCHWRQSPSVVGNDRHIYIITFFPSFLLFFFFDAIICLKKIRKPSYDEPMATKTSYQNIDSRCVTAIVAAIELNFTVNGVFMHWSGKRKNSPSRAHVLEKAWNLALLRCCFADDG